MASPPQRELAMLGTHVILVAGRSAEEARERVRRFFSKTPLVRYDRIDFADDILSGSDKEFRDSLDAAVAENRRLLAGLIDELAAAGCKTKQDLLELRQGYESKILHVVAHFLDGFIGIDSAFYNLIDDSHWLSDETASAIEAAPGEHWLFSLNGYSHAPNRATVLHR